LAPVIDRGLDPLAKELVGLRAAWRPREARRARADHSLVLQSLVTFHRSLERALADAHHLREFDSAAIRREEVLMRDLRILGGRLPLRSGEFLDQFDSLARAWSRSPRMGLAGAVYAVERERVRSLKFVPALAGALHVSVAPLHGLDYYLEGSDSASRRCDRIATWIEAHACDRERAKEVMVGAVQAMRVLVFAQRAAAAEPR
jgi:hypothetical protein